MTTKPGLGIPHFNKRSKSQRSKSQKTQSTTNFRRSDEHHFLPIGRKIEEMISFGNNSIDQMPRNHKPVIGKILESFMWDLLDLTTTAGRGFHKAKTLETAVVRLDLLRSAVRDANRRCIISPSIYRKWAQMNDDIGRDLGAWYQQDKESKKRLKN